MSLLSSFSAPPGLTRFVREVRAILLANEGGIRWADNVGPTVTYKALGNTTTRVRSGVKRRPLAVLLLAAKAPSGFTNTGGQLGWEWLDGDLSVTTPTGLSGSVEYEITLGLLMG